MKMMWKFLIVIFSILDLSITIRKPAVDHEQLKHLFCKHRKILKDLNYNKEVFHNIAKEIDFKLSPKAIHLYFYRHFHKTWVVSDLDECLGNANPQEESNCDHDFTTGCNMQDIILPSSATKFQNQAFPINLISSDKKVLQSVIQDDDTVQLENSVSPVYSNADKENNDTFELSSMDVNVTEKENSSKIPRQNISAIYKFPIDIYESTNLLPRSKVYKRVDGSQPYRQRKVLPKFQWSPLLREKIWQYCRTKCTIQFTYFFRAGTIYFNGKCTQCSALYKIQTEMCTDQIHELSCTVLNYDKKFRHKKNKKIRMTSHLSKIYAKKLLNSHACIVRTGKANEIMKSNEVEPPIVPSLAALRQLKHSVRKERWLDDDVLLSLIKMGKGPYRSVIRYVSLIPNIDIYYYTEDQSNYFKEYYLKYSGDVTISVNATGSMFRQVILKTGEVISKRLFLYTVLVTSNENLISVPICQKISDSHTCISIRDWLSNFFDYVIPNKPAEVITDDSSALILAAVQVFTRFETTNEYLKAAFALLFGKSNTQMPEVYLRLDTSHFFKTIYNLPCWADVDEDVKGFYLKCLTFMKKSEDFITVKTILENMLIVISNKYENANVSSKFNCAEAKKNIGETIKVFKADYEFYKYQYIEENHTKICKNIDDPDDPDLIEINLLQWFDDMVTSTKNLKETPTLNVNPLYFPRFIPTLRRLIIKLPMWSNIMIPFFKSKNRAPSSSANENYFKTLKSYVAKTKMNKCRIDEFIQIHSEYLGGQLKLALSNLITCNIMLKKGESEKKKKKRIIKKKKPTKKFKQSKTTQNLDKSIRSKKERNSKSFFVEDSVFSDAPTYIENWKGEGRENINKESSHPITFMKNGSISEKLYLINTCAFDSACHLLAFAYFKSVELKNALKHNKTLFADFIKNLVNSSKMDSLLALREQICDTHFNLRSPISQSFQLNCECAVSYIYEKIFMHYGIFSTYYNKRCLNEKCKLQIGRAMPFVSLDVQTLSLFGISALEESISSDIIIHKSKSSCGTCEGYAEYWYTLQKHLFFEITGLEQSTLSAQLEDVPKTLMVRGSIYELIGVIEFVKPLQGQSIGHYKSHIYKGNSQWVCYDDLNPSIQISAETKYDISIITYVIL